MSTAQEGIDDLKNMTAPNSVTPVVVGDTIQGVLDEEYNRLPEQGGWKDLVQPFSSARGSGTTEPLWRDMGNGQYAFNFDVGEELFVAFHVLHDYKRGSMAYPHVHFLVDQTMTAGQQITWRFAYVLAKGHRQGQSLTAPETIIDMTYTATGSEIVGEHLIVECSDLDAFDLIEPDSVLMARVELLSENVTGRIYGLMCDLHYQADRFATINKAPDFYT